MIIWKVFAPSLTAFQQWHSYYNSEFKKISPDIRRDYMGRDTHLLGLRPPIVVAFIDQWESNTKLGRDYVEEYLTSHGYDLDNLIEVDWCKAKLASFQGIKNVQR